MSQWTHVVSVFRIDSFGKITDEEIKRIFGEQLDYDDMCDLEFDYKTKYLPMGSEGSLKMSIWHNPDESCMASTTVNVFGDLRDYDSFEELELWFSDICKDTFLRQAIMEVEVEGLKPRLYSSSQYRLKGDK